MFEQFGLRQLESDQTTFTCDSCLVLAVSLQSLWSLALFFIDAYALLVKRSLRNHLIVQCFTVGDGVSTLWSLSLLS